MIETRTKTDLVRKKGASALVQYQDGNILKRVYIPVDEFGDGHVLDDVLESGIPYGYPWEDLDVTFDGARFANELHNLDVWTVEDALNNPQKLWSALRATLSDNINEILTVASQEKKMRRTNGK